jgi:hypothetical protein
MFLFTVKYAYSQSEKVTANLPNSRPDTSLFGLPFRVIVVGEAFITREGGLGKLVGVSGDSTSVKLGADGKIDEVFIYGDTIVFEYAKKQEAVLPGKKKE